MHFFQNNTNCIQTILVENIVKMVVPDTGGEVCKKNIMTFPASEKKLEKHNNNGIGTKQPALLGQGVRPDSSARKCTTRAQHGGDTSSNAARPS